MSYIQTNTTGSLTDVAVSGITPYTSYTCIIHAANASDGPDSFPVTVTTAEEGTLLISIDYFTSIPLTVPFPPVLVEVAHVDSV